MSTSKNEKAQNETFTDEEIRAIERQANDSMAALIRLVRERARAAYSVVDWDVLQNCTREHMNFDQSADMLLAHRYTCPVCGTLLKDRSAADQLTDPDCS